MALLVALVGTVGTLAGVALGTWLSGRVQVRVALTQREHEALILREDAYVQFLTAYRQFRRYILSEAPAVRLVQTGDLGRNTPVVEGAAKHWEAVESAQARLQIVAGHSRVEAAGKELRSAIYDLARARASVPIGSVPREPITRLRNLENSFAEVARDDLAERRRLDRSQAMLMTASRSSGGPGG